MNTIKYIAFLILVLSHLAHHGQMTDECTPCRKGAVAGVSVVGTLTSYLLLDQLWYANYPRSGFHSFNDNSEWLQMDKAGHAMTSYTVGHAGYDVFKWSGFAENQSLYIGGSAGLIYLTGIELMDAKSSQWGFSWGDMIANFSGTSLFILQQKFWKEERITLKFSYSNSEFADVNPEALGRNFQQRLFKDYNAQTYWSSFNVHSFLASGADFPRWINIALGYGATEMTSAKMNLLSVNNFQRKREFYISFDADLNRIRWPKKWMKITARILSFIKLPSPTFEVRSDGKMKLHALFF
jgi:uncharacterized protein YfiM (DUF2279 family)